MKKILFIFAFLATYFSALAKENMLPVPQASKEAQEEAKIDPSKLPSLGTCDPYTDYYIYKCQPFKCRLQVADYAGAIRQMEALGLDENGLCQFNFKLEVNAPNFPKAELRFKCKLSTKGVLEMANQFTQYKKGKIEYYSNPPVNDILNKECRQY